MTTALVFAIAAVLGAATGYAVQWYWRRRVVAATVRGMLEVQAANFGIERLHGETDSALAARIVARVQTPAWPRERVADAARAAEPGGGTGAP